MNSLPRPSSRSGFGLVGIVIVLLVIGLIGLVGWAVVSGNKQPPAAADTTSAARPPAPTPVSPQPPILPGGYSRFTSKAFSFSFGYPNSYGELTEVTPGETNDYSVQHAFYGRSPSAQSPNGHQGPIRVFVYKPDVRELSSRGNGPMISLKNDKWYVSRENASDSNSQKIGEEYTEFWDEVDSPLARGEGKVYSFDGEHEGCSAVKYVFVSKGRLVEVLPPTFCDASFSNGSSIGPTADQFESNTRMLKSIVNSIWITR
ncbi:MAG TPA: hypothetical protein VF572_04120 [Candidatus Saccharimonadales bacterium]